eukprot:8240685-Alexandrium_andersonii.AAC.1
MGGRRRRNPMPAPRGRAGGQPGERGSTILHYQVGQAQPRGGAEVWTERPPGVRRDHELGGAA